MSKHSLRSIDCSKHDQIIAERNKTLDILKNQTDKIYYREIPKAQSEDDKAQLEKIYNSNRSRIKTIDDAIKKFNKFCS